MGHSPGERPDIVIFGNLKAQGGASRSLVNIIPEWVAAGINVQLVGYRNAERFYPDELPSCVQLHHLGTRLRLTTLWHFWRYLRMHRPAAILGTNHLDNLLVAIVGAVVLAQRESA